MERNLNQSLIDRIDAFEQGHLTATELKSFQQELITNNELTTHYNYILRLKAALKQQRNDRLVNDFKNWDQLSRTNPQNNNAAAAQLTLRRKWMAIAASFLFLTIAGWWMLSSSSDQMSHLALFDQYFSPYPCTTLERSNAEEKGFVLYSLNKFDLAKESLENSKDADAKFYLANTYLALGESQAAISTLNNYKGEKFSSVLDWYLALSYLQANKMDEAIRLLNQLAAAKGDYSFRAAEVLQALAK